MRDAEGYSLEYLNSCHQVDSNPIPRGYDESDTLSLGHISDYILSAAVSSFDRSDSLISSISYSYLKNQ